MGNCTQKESHQVAEEKHEKRSALGPLLDVDVSRMTLDSLVSSVEEMLLVCYA